MARWQSCNVLQVGKEGRHVWHFSGGGERLQRHETRLPTEPLPASLIAKDWQTLLQPKLNIAWLPADQVFLRVVQLPKCELGEMQSMVELQLEKVSPLPVAQIVWSFQPLPQPAAELQTVIVIIVARNLVEDFLGKIETQGYLADRVELPLLDQLRATKINEDGVWIYPGIGTEKDHCLLAWWYGGMLCNIFLLQLPQSEKRAAQLREQLSQITWAGELEGWLASSPKLHLVTDTAAAEPWLLTFIQEESVHIIAPAAADDVATLTARRVASNGLTTNLLPPEYAARYKQQFIDHLWMRALGAVLAIYLMGIAAYFGWVQVAQFKLDAINAEVVKQSSSYTNSIRLKENVKVLQDQLDLQYAALECYKAIADVKPTELPMDSLNFSGRKLTISGSAAADDITKVQDFNAALRTAEYNHQPLFNVVPAPTITPRPGQNQIAWTFRDIDLKRTDAE